MTRCVLDWLDAAAQRAANALAVDAPDSALTWAQMRAQAPQPMQLSRMLYAMAQPPFVLPV